MAFKVLVSQVLVLNHKNLLKMDQIINISFSRASSASFWPSAVSMVHQNRNQNLNLKLIQLFQLPLQQQLLLQLPLHTVLNTLTMLFQPRQLLPLQLLTLMRLPITHHLTLPITLPQYCKLDGDRIVFNLIITVFDHIFTSVLLSLNFTRNSFVNNWFTVIRYLVLLHVFFSYAQKMNTIC